MPNVATMECSGRTHVSAPGFAERSPQRICFGHGNVRMITGRISAMHVDRGAAGLLDQRNVEVALLRVALDFRFVERRKPGRLEEALHRRIGRADLRALALVLQIGLPRRNAVHGQREAAWRDEGLCALVDETFGDQLVRYHAAQIVGGLGLHPRRDFFREQFEQKIGHQAAAPPASV